MIIKIIQLFKLNDIPLKLEIFNFFNNLIECNFNSIKNINLIDNIINISIKSNDMMILSLESISCSNQII